MVDSNIVLARVLLSVALQIIYNVFGRGVRGNRSILPSSSLEENASVSTYIISPPPLFPISSKPPTFSGMMHC